MLRPNTALSSAQGLLLRWQVLELGHSKTSLSDNRRMLIALHHRAQEVVVKVKAAMAALHLNPVRQFYPAKSKKADKKKGRVLPATL